MNNVFEAFTLLPAKLQPKITIFQHGVDTYQVVKYLIDKNKDIIQNSDLIRVAALVHDIGKAEQNWQRDQWIHTKHTRKYLEPLLEDKFFVRLIKDRGLKIPEDRELLVRICEEHHNPSPQLIKACKESLLVSIGDVVASFLEGGMVGKIDDLLRAYPYTQLNLALIKNLGFDGLDGEIHRIDLPSNFVEDVFLANMIFLALRGRMAEIGLYALLQKDSTLWVVGEKENVKKFFEEIKIDPKLLYDEVFDMSIYDSILSSMPPIGAIQVDSMRFILVNEGVAKKLAINLIERDAVRNVLEKYDFSIAEIKAKFEELGLEKGIDWLWGDVKNRIETITGQKIDVINVSEMISEVANGKKSRSELRVVDKVDISNLDKISQKDISELLKLFDASGNYYRSITNVLLEYRNMIKWVGEGKFSILLSKYALLDGEVLISRKEIKNPKLCPICRTFEQEQKAQALISGYPKTDSIYHIYKGEIRGMINLCGWCFLAGYVDLPIATILREGQSISKEKEYLYISSPLSREELQQLLDYISGRIPSGEVSQKIEEDLSTFIAEATGGKVKGFDQLSVLGLSKERLANTKGFVLPSINDFSTLFGVYLPFDSLVSMKAKTSGSVKRALILAAFYDLHLLTHGSLHYGRLGKEMFSIYGRGTSLKEIERANSIFEIASKYARTGFDLNTGLYMLFFDDPRMAANLVFRKMNRSGYSLGADKVQEVIDLVEKIAKEDWVFNLGLEITELLIELGLLPRAKGTWKSPTETFSGVELVKWLQNFKMVRDENSARNWATRVINGIKREREKGPNQEEVKKILDLTEKIIQECKKNNMNLSEFSRTIANMDQYLLFYYNQKVAGSEKPEVEK